MATAVIINPRSGRQLAGVDRAADRDALARRLMAAAGIDGRVEVTRARDHGASIARTLVAEGIDRIVAWGGDGTINEIAGPIVHSRTVLGIVPAGSGDGLARSLGLPRDAETALMTALTAPAAPIDVGFLADRHFLNIAGVGFDAEVGVAFNQRAKRGGFGYASIGLSRVWSYGCHRYRVELDGTVEDAQYLLIAFANGREYGNGITISSTSSPSDGWLDAVIVKGGHPFQSLWRARRLFWRRNAPAAGVRRTRLRSGSISGERLVCHVDGETFTASGEIKVRLDAGAIGVAGVTETP